MASRLLWFVSAVAVFAVLFPTQSAASPLTLNYTVHEVSPGLFDYEFTLVLDNHDGAWSLGENFNWIIFGASTNVADGTDGTLNGFIGDSGDLPVGPFGSYSHSSGGYNGPTLIDASGDINSAGWKPTAVGESLFWSGTSTVFLGQGDLLFTHLVGESRGVMEVGNLTAAPEPGSMLLLGTALLGAGMRRWRRRKA